MGLKVSLYFAKHRHFYLFGCVYRGPKLFRSAFKVRTFVLLVTVQVCRSVIQPCLPPPPSCLVLSDTTFVFPSIHCPLSFCLPVVLFLVEDNGTAVVLSAIAGSSMQGTAVSEALYVPEPFSVARYPLLQDRLALCACCH